MRLSLSAISTVQASFAEDVAAYASAGFDAIGLWEMKLPTSDAANIALLAARGLGVSNCVPAIPSFLPLGIPGMEGPAEPEERIEALCASVRRLARYRPESVLCLSGPLGGRSTPEGRRIVVEGLRRVGAAAREADVPLALEPVHRSQRESVSFVNSISDAFALLDEAGLHDAGILLDTFHVWDDPSVWDTIGRASYRIKGVHVADWPADERDPERALPGEGTSNTRDLLQMLDLAGFSGSLDAEIFSVPGGFWALPVDEAARRVHAALAAIAP
ncbi:MAG: sugar phosphate isomerase/epimerase [Thermoleophilia bacterium]|nr:sugar phosphate isomerase/epimerase [Thermoleophilia bacterium]